MRKMKKEGIKLFIVELALASFLMLVFCIVAASPDSTLQFIDPTPANYTQEQDFTWGVLAINTHKSIYLPNEAASIGIAVLDNEGRMVCDAAITLTITDPSNNETVLSTGNGLIKVSPQCSVYGVTNLPDFYTNYTVDGAGTYVINLTAVTANGTKSITDEFSVQNSVDFDVARDGATRIYPPVPYVMNFTIEANKNYTGLIREYVPASFVITPQDGLIVTTVGDIKILTWTKNLVEGETYNIYYEFDAPDVSPYLFTLGELETGDWKEVRQWMIASDLSGTIRPDGDTTSQWNVIGGTGTHASVINEAVTQPTPGTTTDYVDNNAAASRKDQYTMETISGIATDVQVWVYAKCAEASRGMSITLYWEKNEHATGGITTSSTADTWEWASTTYSGLTLGRTELDSLEVRIQGDTNKITYSVATLYADVTYTVPPWKSWKTVTHEDEWGTVADPYDTDTNTVYMYSSAGFIANHVYYVGYYDAAGDKPATETGFLDGTSLSSQYLCTSYGAQSGTWHAVVFDDAVGSPPTSYTACSGAVGYMAEHEFEVNPGAIPEFPTVIAAIAVCMLCAVAYVVMRRRAGKG